MPALNLFPNRFVTRLRAAADDSEKLRLERVAATARAFLAVSAMIAIYIGPPQPSRYVPICYLLMGGYLIYSLLVLWLIGKRPSWFRHVFLLQAVDVLIPAVFTMFTHGPGSPVFVFFVFITATAALRWGLPETLFTAVVVLLLMLLQALLLLASGSTELIKEGEYDLDHLLLRVSFMLVVGVLLGYIAEQQKELRSEDTVIRRLLAGIHPEHGLRLAVQVLMTELLRIFRARKIVTVVQQLDTGRVFVWTAKPGSTSHEKVEVREAAVYEREVLMFPSLAHSFHAERHADGIWTTWSLNDEQRVPGQDIEPGRYPEAADVHSMTCVAFKLGDQWSGRLILYDGITGWDRGKELRFAQKLLDHAGPAIYTVYLLRRLKSRAGAIERARVARELHDGTIQALISIEMQVDVLRRQAAKTQDEDLFAAELSHLQELLREQVTELRNLMQEMRPVELAPGQLLDYLANLVDRFRRDTGMSAQFITHLEDLDLPPRVCREVARIVQEALVNIRKHSGASKVLVRFGVTSGSWRLAIEDNGRGFDFMGRLSLSDLDLSHKGPAIIKERVRTIGGDLSIESLPGRGANLEITFPQKSHHAYA